MVAAFRREGKADAEPGVVAILREAADRAAAREAGLIAADPRKVPAFVILPASSAGAAVGDRGVAETRAADGWGGVRSPIRPGGGWPRPRRGLPAC